MGIVSGEDLGGPASSLERMPAYPKGWGDSSGWREEAAGGGPGGLAVRLDPAQSLLSPRHQTGGVICTPSQVSTTKKGEPFSMVTTPLALMVIMAFDDKV